MMKSILFAFMVMALVGTATAASLAPAPPSDLVITFLNWSPMMILLGAVLGGIAGIFHMIEDGKLKLPYVDEEGSFNLGELDALIIAMIAGIGVVVAGYPLPAAFIAGLIGKPIIYKLRDAGKAFFGIKGS